MLTIARRRDIFSGLCCQSPGIKFESKVACNLKIMQMRCVQQREEARRWTVDVKFVADHLSLVVLGPFLALSRVFAWHRSSFVGKVDTGTETPANNTLLFNNLYFIWANCVRFVADQFVGWVKCGYVGSIFDTLSRVCFDWVKFLLEKLTMEPSDQHFY